MFDKILVANRGEIACRVMRTARRLGIATVAVFSEADRNALHLQFADEVVGIGPAASRESYLAVDRIVEACLKVGASAVHPGYGFLAENADFCERLEGEGITFIGPRAESIRTMGDKIAAKAVAQRAGVSVIPGSDLVPEDEDAACRLAAEIGYPVMLKAAAGGGGKGMRTARDEAQLRGAFGPCRNEARSSFGDDRVFVEKFVEDPRHIEFQVLGDAFGNVVHLWERDCSIQRRHQKVIEEAPSPRLDQGTREAMGAQAVALAKAAGYQSAGTVEFVVDRGRRVLLPRDEHPHPGRAPRHRDDHGGGPCRGHDPRRRGRAAAVHPGGHPLRRLGARVPYQRGGPVPQLPALDGAAGAVHPAARDRGRACGWTRASRRADACRRTTTR